MPDKIIQYEGGDVLATEEPLTVTGLLLPYNEVGRTNLGRFQVEAGAVEIPTDPTGIGTNRDHIRHDVVGGITRLEDRPTADVPGVYATIKFADTPDGQAAYKDATSGQRRKLSAEFGPAVIKAGKLVAGHAKLWGSAIVNAGAFPSAQVLAADTPDEDLLDDEEREQDDQVDEATETVEKFTDEVTDEDGTTHTRTMTRTTRTEPDGDGGTKITITEKTVIEEPDPEPATQEEEEPAVSVPNTFASKSSSHITTTPRPVNIRQVYAAIASYRSNPNDVEAHNVLAALTDIKISGANALPTTDVLRPNWLGQIYQGIPYEREYIQLSQLGTDITAAGKKGFTVHRGTTGVPIADSTGIPNGGTWAGNKVEINSYNGFTQTASSSLRRFAVGHDIAREFYDLPGGEEVVEAFLKLVIEDHLVWSDEWALYDMNTAAGVPIAPATASFPNDYPAALGILIQGILAVKAKKGDRRRDVPTYAIANEEAYAALVYAAGGEQHLPAFVDIAISTNSNGTVDGGVHIVQGDTGITGSASVIVGAKKAVEFDELAGGPLIVNALELAKGGIDRAVHGYLQTFPVRAEAVVRIGTPEDRATDTAYPLGRIVKQGSTIYRATAAGTTHASTTPSAPAVGATVVDGTVTWLRLA